jgi:hypothetical protein
MERNSKHELICILVLQYFNVLPAIAGREEGK